ncbi:3-succinoylsemialdehyde-pyridine dehydrogenase [Cupriavidus taiwanensis]|uniref:aldehyde dehydrogenase (NAD(+)) n=1 Tax=Cupriavidus taiwanensis TaxID=164546 RepID=A0A9Q7UR32_9BURK|nr:aldehyde dehydrogenase family protein [Cupriavidus taiwanensis]SPD64733.1 3-succinoylsemialdehyde-pyridine dehydrogenase [Cupriavidus taiwanensis]
MNHCHTYAAGAWFGSGGSEEIDLVDSYTEEAYASLRASSRADVDVAVASARSAGRSWAQTPVEVRANALARIAEALAERADELAQAITREVGMPRKLSRRIQVDAPIRAWRRQAELAATLARPERIGHSIIERLPVGVVACITPWNYPLHQLTAKVACALAAGCTVVVKPSEVAPSSGFILADAVASAGLPAGVFNLVNGRGDIGEALVAHPDVDMVSFTGSTAVGRRIAAAAGAQLKRVALELGGKSAALIVPDADLAAAVKATLANCLLNSGQTCSALSRLLVPRARYAEVVAMLREQVKAYVMGDPADPATRLGPLASMPQLARVRALVDAAIADGAAVIAGGPDALPVPSRGFFFAPTVLGNVDRSMPIAQQEVFGPVLVLLAYDNVDEAVAIANGTRYGLAASVWGPTPDAAWAVARRLRAGQIDLNGAPFNPDAPFGGFGDSGIGRENGPHGLHEFVDTVSYQLPADYIGNMVGAS